MRILPRYDVALNERHVLNLVETKFDLLERLLQERNYDGAASVYSTLLGEMKESDGLAFTVRINSTSHVFDKTPLNPCID